jgi:hypothetical protein
MLDQSSGSREARRVHAAAPIGIRPADIRDAATIAALIAQQPGRLAQSVPPTVADIEMLLQREHSGMLVFEVIGTLAGALGYTVDGPALRLFSLSVEQASPLIAEETVARQLILATEELGRDRGVSLVATEVERHGKEFDAFAAAGYAVDFEETQTAGSSVITVADLIKLL